VRTPETEPETWKTNSPTPTTQEIMKLPVVLILTLVTSSLCGKEKLPDLQELNNWYRYTTQKYGCVGDCDYNAVLNTMKLGEEELWPIVTEPTAPGGFMHAPCGSSIECGDEKEMFAPNVKCSLTINDCDSLEVLETLHLDCRGDMVCIYENKPSHDCCTVTGSTPGDVNDGEPIS
jgi:hypothetical protein